MKSKTLHSYNGMISRCNRKTDPYYPCYGGRGITVCSRWLESFSNFLSDMGDKPANLSLDRIDNNGNYCKENCRWATALQQANNNRSNRLIHYAGEVVTLAEGCRKYGIPRMTVRYRMKTGWPDSQLFDPRIPRGNLYAFRGKIRTCKEIAAMIPMSAAKLRCRLARGWPLDAAVIDSLKAVCQYKGV